MKIEITIEQYNAIHALKDFAKWYIDEHENASGSRELIEQWESDRDEVERGIKALDDIDSMLHYS